MTSPNTHLVLGPSGTQLVQAFESLWLVAAPCPEGVPTVGWGHTGPDVINGQRITRERAERLFRDDMAEHEAAVKRAIHAPLSQLQFDALVSFSFNVGSGWLTGKRRGGAASFVARLNAGDYACVPPQLLRFVRGNRTGRAYNGLLRRRQAEAALWVGDLELAHRLEPAVTAVAPQSVAPERGALKPTKSGTVYGAFVAAVGFVFSKVEWLVGNLSDLANEAADVLTPTESVLTMLGVALPWLGAAAVAYGLYVVFVKRWIAARELKTG